MKNNKKISVIVLSSLVLLLSGTAMAQSSYLELSDSIDEKKVWGSGLEEASAPLNVEVEKDSDMMRFSASHPEVGEGTAFAFDFDSDGVADRQVIYDSSEWKIKDVESNSWSGLKDLSESYSATMNSDSAVLELPVSELKDAGREYRFGVQVNLGKGEQMLYPEEDGLWYDGSDYIGSSMYKTLKVDHFEKDTTVQDTQRSESSILGIFDEAIESFFDSVIKPWVEDTQASEERVDQLEEQVQRLELENRQMEKTMSELYDGTSLDRPSKLQSAQEMMLENNISELTVEHDGQEWSCKLKNPERAGQAREAVCVA